MTVSASMVLAINLICLLSLALGVSATPIPLPLPLTASDYTLKLGSANGSVRSISPRRLQSLPMDLSIFSDEHAGGKRDLDLDSLYRSYDEANSYAGLLGDMASTSSGVDSDNNDFQKQYVDALTGFNDQMSTFQTALAKASSDKGLANYDRQNDVEVLLKKLINANKNVLSSTTTVIYNIPGIGPVLGPIVYDIKCLVDGLLDATEDLTDAIVNAVGPLLQALLGQASEVVCKSGVEIAGLCV